MFSSPFSDLALKYVKSSTLTMRLSGLAFINQQVTICEKRQNAGRNNAGGGRLSPESQQALNLSKATFKRWVKANQMVSVLFGANTHVELVRQCHLVLQFMACSQLLTEEDVDVLWIAVNDKHKGREVISAIDRVLHFLGEPLLERFSKRLQQLPLLSHTEQTFSLSCQVTKVLWRRQIMTLNLAHQFGNILASEKRKRKHRGSNLSVTLPSTSQNDTNESDCYREPSKVSYAVFLF